MKHFPDNNKAVPILGFQEFIGDNSIARSEILFNELVGDNHINEPHSHDFFMIILFEKSAGIHNIDSVSYNIGDKEVHVLFPGQIHHWKLENETKGFQLMIQQPFLEQFAPFFRFSFTNYQNNPIIKLNDEVFTKLKYEFHAIKEELLIDNLPLNLISARAAVIAALVSSQAENSFEEFKVYQSNERLATFNGLIDQHFKENKSVKFYADLLHVSPNYLNILCKRNLKLTAIQLIHQRILTEAKRLLLQNKFSIKEIAYDLGFTDIAHFSHFFKKHTDSNPSDFRNFNVF